MARLEQEVIIINKLGLHARAAARLVTLASLFSSDIRLRLDEREVNGKSIMGVLMLAASRGTKLSIVAEGDDASRAIDELVKLINDRFGEAE